MNNTDGTTVTVLVDDTGAVRGLTDRLFRRVPIQAEELAVNVNVFLDTMGGILEKTPEEVGKFQLTEFAISAEITGQGKVVLCGVGGEAAISGGLKFVFKRKEN